MKINSNTVRRTMILHIFLVLIFHFLWSVLHVPWELIYIADLLACLEFAWAARMIYPVFKRTKLQQIIPYFLIFTLYLLLTQLCNGVSPIVSAVAYRKIFRFYLFYFACAVLMTPNGINRIMNLLLKLQIVNFPLTLYQYFVMHIDQDYLGGIFGTKTGANVYTNVFLCIICTYMVVNYLAKREKLLPMLLTLGSSLLIAVLAELKVFFIEIVVIVLLAILFSKPSKRTVKVLAFSAAGSVAALALFSRLFPEHMAILMDKALFTQYTTSVVTGYNIGRLNAFSQINEIFFKDSLIRNLFGFGFGNCEVNSAFYALYGEYNYIWFAHQVTFMETGYVGVALYALFFILVFWHAMGSKKVDPENATYYTLTQITCVMCGIWFVYNQSLRIEVAYLIFFTLAIPVALRKEWAKERCAD